MNLGEINHFLGLPDFKADIMQKERGGKQLPFWTEFISKDFLISGLHMEEIPSSNWKRWDAKKWLIWMLSLWCQSHLGLNEHITRNIKTERPQTRKFRIKREKQLFPPLFFISASGIMFCLAGFSERRNKENQTN